MHSKYLALLSTAILAARGIALPSDTIQPDAFETLGDDVTSVESKLHVGASEAKSFIKDHEHKEVKTTTITESNGGPTMTVVSKEGGPAVTLAPAGQDGEKTKLGGHTYTIIPATFIHPSSMSSPWHSHSSKKEDEHHSSSSTKSESPAAASSVHAVETTITSGKSKATVVSVSDGPVVTLAAPGSKESTLITVIGHSTYTVEKPGSSASASGSASASDGLASNNAVASGSSSTSASASASASSSQVPNAAAPRHTNSYASAVAGAVVIAVSVLYGALSLV